jgi:hypothetical protein
MQDLCFGDVDRWFLLRCWAAASTNSGRPGFLGQQWVTVRRLVDDSRSHVKLDLEPDAEATRSPACEPRPEPEDELGGDGGTISVSSHISRRGSKKSKKAKKEKNDKAALRKSKSKSKLKKEKSSRKLKKGMSSKDLKKGMSSKDLNAMMNNPNMQAQMKRSASKKDVSRAEPSKSKKSKKSKKKKKDKGDDPLPPPPPPPPPPADDDDDDEGYVGYKLVGGGWLEVRRACVFSELRELPQLCSGAGFALAPAPGDPLANLYEPAKGEEADHPNLNLAEAFAAEQARVDSSSGELEADL